MPFRNPASLLPEARLSGVLIPTLRCPEPGTPLAESRLSGRSVPAVRSLGDSFPVLFAFLFISTTTVVII
ncbi:hypothetical protein BFAG_01236 [Bacteroides fragilis 3_1_12]|uniref:Uncharacterized protein n=1 Tax=Bacteroides fragilis 3_1_12 TaxID=457424 RepID=A0ABN0BI40_BACFG|nr:hypothetical protein BFAG_01236 [Bacteroides fragilis 3_1_12]